MPLFNWEQTAHPDDTGHPEHRVQREVAPGLWEVARPEEPSDLLLRWSLRRRCRKAGGHWWHPEGMIDWFCCKCGKQTEGMPKDGSRG